MSDFVLVRHKNGHIGPVSRDLAKLRKLDVVEGDAVDLTGRPVKVTRGNGRPVKPTTTVAKTAAAKRTRRPAAKKTAAAKDAAEQAVTPPEGAAENTLTDTKE